MAAPAIREKSILLRGLRGSIGYGIDREKVEAWFIIETTGTRALQVFENLPADPPISKSKKMSKFTSEYYFLGESSCIIIGSCTSSAVEINLNISDPILTPFAASTSETLETAVRHVNRYHIFAATPKSALEVITFICSLEIVTVVLPRTRL